MLGFIDICHEHATGIEAMDLRFRCLHTSKHGSGVLPGIRDARASGPAIGVSADGYIDRPNNVLSLRGSIAPLYGVNSILGMIPLLGNVLTSKEGEERNRRHDLHGWKGNVDEPDQASIRRC